MTSQMQAIEQKVAELLSNEPDSFLVEVKINAGNNVKVFVDADQGMSLERLVKYNRQLYRQIEESGLFPNGDFSLEVSSPGLDEPLRLQRQYQKNLGRYVEVVMKDGIKKEGRLLSTGESSIVVEEEIGKGKKKELVQHSIPMENIKSTRVQVKF
jgi:ribosome maturation factor RimP